MKNISTGAGLALLGLGIAAHPLVANFASSAAAAAAASTAPTAAAIATASSAQAGSTVVWMGVTRESGWLYFHRLWSDGRIENRLCGYMYNSCGPDPDYSSYNCDWTEVPPPPGGDGFACRTDINGDRIVDGADLTFVLDGWGQQGGCEPDATYPCLNLADLAGGAVAAK